MRACFDGIGQWAATFECLDVQAGQVVKISGGGQVSSCKEGEDFCGLALALGRDRRACSVAMGGMVTVRYSGAAPALGWTGLAADGKGGVQAKTDGRSYLVADVDVSGERVTFAL